MEPLHPHEWFSIVMLIASLTYALVYIGHLPDDI